MPTDISPRAFNVSVTTLREIAQGLLEVKKMARGIENSLDAFLPLVNSDSVRSQLVECSGRASGIARDVSSIYHSIARDAFGEEQPR